MASTRTAPDPATMPPPQPGTGLSQVPEAPRAGRTIRLPEAAPASSATPPSGPGVGPTVLRGMVWGPVAIGAAALLQMWASAQAGDEAVRPLRMMTVLLEGGAGLVNGNPLAGVGVNVVIGLAVGLVTALLSARVRPVRSVLLVGLAVGAGVFAADHLLLGPLASQVFELRDPVLLLASRLVMGAVLAYGLMPRDT